MNANVQAVIDDNPAKFERALRLIADKGRCYKHSGRYTIIRVFTQSAEEAKLLCEVFGGGYTHRKPGSYIWTCGRMPTLLMLRKSLPTAMLATKFNRLLELQDTTTARKAA